MRQLGDPAARARASPRRSTRRTSAAIIIEPVQGEGGFVPVPPRFLRRIRELCDQHGIVMIADEVQCGFARTGKLFALEHYGLVADIVVTGKSLGAGMPISAITGRADIMDAAACRRDRRHLRRQPADLRRRDRRDRDDAPARLPRARRADRRRCCARRWSGWKTRHPLIGDVRGLGSMMLIELVKDRASKEPRTR